MKAERKVRVMGCFGVKSSGIRSRMETQAQSETPDNPVEEVTYWIPTSATVPSVKE